MSAQSKDPVSAETAQETFTVQLDAASGRIVVVGELDDDTVPALREAVHLACRTGRCDLAIDLAGVSFLGAAGVNLLVEVHDWQQGAGLRLEVVGASSWVDRVIRICDTDWLLTATLPIRPATEPPRSGGDLDHQRAVI